VDARDYWYHKIELPGGIETPGWAPINRDVYSLPEDLTGKRVLDIGAWDGYWTWEALKRGADYVFAIDDFSDPGDAVNDDVPRARWENFDICKDAFGYGDDRVQRAEMSLYDLSPSRHGMFDVIMCFGVMYHLRYPLKALDELFSMCKPNALLLIESATLDNYSPYRGGVGNGYRGDQMVMEFYPGVQYAGVSTNWWVPTLRCLSSMVWAAGFRDVEHWHLCKDPEELPYCRGFVKGVAA
jgi:tRNA (mo5U34)-methyltransferase